MKNKKLKAGWSHYWSPSPKNFRRFGDALLAVVLVAETTPMLDDYPKFKTHITLSYDISIPFTPPVSSWKVQCA